MQPEAHRTDTRSAPLLRAVAVAVIVLFATSSCATIVRGTTQRVKIETVPAGAKVWVDGTARGESPVVVTVSRSDMHTVKVAAEGYEDLTVQTDKEIGAGFIVVDILFGGVWLIVDAITGAWNGAGPSPLRIVLSPVGQDCATGNCDYIVSERSAQ